MKLLILALLIATIIVIIFCIYHKRVEFITSNMNDKLKESEEKIRILLVNLNVGIAVFSAVGDLIECNQRFLELANPDLQSNDPLLEQSRLNQALIKPLAIVHFEEIIKHYISEQGVSITMDEFPLTKVIAFGKPLHDQIIGVRNPNHGDVIWTMADLEPEFDDTGTLYKIIVTLVDITGRKQAEEALKESQNRLQTFLKVIPDLFVLLDPDGQIIDVYLGNTNVTSFTHADFIGKSYKDFVDEDTSNRVRQSIQQLFETGEIQTLDVSKIINGREVFYEVRFVLNMNGNILAVVRDVTERKESVAELYNMSIRDTLTGLYNRNYFEQELDHYQTTDLTGMGMVICDVDGLKLVNDTLGHAVGDDYLKSTSEILVQCFGKDDVIARIGGDEFAILIQNTTVHEISAIRLKIDELLKLSHSQFSIIPNSLSVGFAIGDGKQKDLRELLKMADMMMYREKLHHLQSEKSKSIDILAKMLEARDFITEGHGDRMQDLSSKLAKVVGMLENDLKDMCLFAQFHDIGKVGIPDRILFKHGKLSQVEMNEMKRHTEIGYSIATSSLELAHISDWILKHHERWDGNGYPFKLKGKEIPLQCRILSIVDAFDAMTNNRPYRKALSHEIAIKEIIRCRGTQFDPELVDLFVNLIK